MKFVHFLPPGLAILLVAIWTYTGERAISHAETTRADLQQQIIHAGGEGSLVAASTKTAKRPVADPDAAVDWQSAAALAAHDELLNAADVRAMLALRERLAKMSREEIIAALDEIEQLGLGGEAQRRLEKLLLDPLIAQDPGYALERFRDRIADDATGTGWQLSKALREWAKRDLPAAQAWFNKQIADGTFDTATLDGKSDLRVQYEAALIESLLATDPNAVAARLAELPDDQRREVLEQIPFGDLSQDVQKTYAELVRGMVPADEQAGSFAHISGQLVDPAGYGRVDAFLDAVQATTAERAAAAIQTAQSRLELLGQRGDVTREHVNELRTWLERQAPGQVDRIIGKALGEASQQSALFHFPLESYAARSNGEQALDLADSISDSKLRAEILNRLK